jgi:hypothetical protein
MKFKKNSTVRRKKRKESINGRPWWVGGRDNCGTTLSTNLNETNVEANLGDEKLRWVGRHGGHDLGHEPK